MFISIFALFVCDPTTSKIDYVKIGDPKSTQYSLAWLYRITWGLWIAVMLSGEGEYNADIGEHPHLSFVGIVHRCSLSGRSSAW